MVQGLSSLLQLGTDASGRKVTKHGRPVDSQRSAVYAWEHKVWNLSSELRRLIPFDEAVALVKQVWVDHRPGERPPEVVKGSGNNADRWQIRLSLNQGTKLGYQVGVVLHEVAHSLSAEGAGHGELYASLYLELMGHYGRVSRTEARRLGIDQRPRRVKFAPKSEVPKRNVREARAWQKEYEELQARWRVAKQALTQVDRELSELRRRKPS